MLKMKKQVAVFLDRDGTINEEVGYLKSLDELSIFPFTASAVGMIHGAGMKAVVVSNQSGVARGFFNEDFVETVHEKINAILSEEGAFIDRFYYCPHHPTEGTGRYLRDCHCRKPKVGMLLQASEELGIDLSRSYMVGDTERDMEAARNAGVTGVLVRTGYGREVGETEGATYAARDLLDAVNWILKDRAH
jgi:D-glycero-D-manno-heptose 1,7-bisphosphate phosphatase